MPPPPLPGQRNTGMLVLSYLGLLALIPLLVEKNDKEVQWHAKHGLVLTACYLVLWVAISIVAYVIPGFFLFFNLVALGALVICILCIVKALNGQRFVIPGISEYADKF
ncbi:MAG TPA: hypothetical protein PK598_11915 [Thermoanaerobaculia bacterium]|nr:hypothetical protein [Thermoanaerobaculia bacterium]